MLMTAEIMAEAHEQSLGILAGRLLKHACHLMDVSEDTDAPLEKARLSDVAAAMARGFRQTLALQARLSREARHSEQEDRARAQADRAQSVTRHRQKIRSGIEALVWTEHEYEDDEGFDLLEDLDEALEADAQRPGFLETSAHAHIARFARKLGLEVPEPEATPPTAAATAPDAAPSAEGEPLAEPAQAGEARGAEGASPTCRANGRAPRPPRPDTS